MLNSVRRHLHRVNNLRELRGLDRRLRADIGLDTGPSLATDDLPLLLLPLGPGDRTRP